MMAAELAPARRAFALSEVKDISHFAPVETYFLFHSTQRRKTLHPHTSSICDNR